MDVYIYRFIGVEHRNLSVDNVYIFPSSRPKLLVVLVFLDL
jgi:hypothetical protein